MAQNILRKNQSKLPMIIFYIVLFLLEFLGVTYITYCYNLYCVDNGITGNFSTETLMASFEYVGKSIELSSDLLVTAFKMLNPDSAQYFQDMNEQLLRNALKVLKRTKGNNN